MVFIKVLPVVNALSVCLKLPFALIFIVKVHHFLGKITYLFSVARQQQTLYAVPAPNQVKVCKIKYVALGKSQFDFLVFVQTWKPKRDTDMLTGEL